MTKQNLTLRPYEAADWPRLMEIHDAARKTELALAGLADAFIPLEQAAINEGLFDYTVIVAVEEQQVRGFVAYSGEELAWLYVDPACQRRGIGRQLTAYALEHQPGIQSVEVLAGNSPARALYEKMGFHLVETLSGQMPGNESFCVQVDCLAR